MRRALILFLAVLTAALTGCKKEIPSPVVDLVSPREGEVLEEDGELTFTVTAPEGELAHIDVRIDDKPVRFPATELRTFARFSVPLPLRELGPGPHLIRIACEAVEDEVRSRIDVARAFSIVLPPAELIEAAVLPPRVEQGQPFAIDLTFDAPVVEASATLFDRTFPFYPRSETEWRALAGCRLLAQPGENALSVTFTDQTGETTVEELTLGVDRGDFESYYIQLSPSVEAKLDPEIIERESARTRAVVSEYTPEQLWEDDGFVRPVSGRVTSPFGQQRTYSNGSSGVHIGVDFSAAEGAPIGATARGRVAIAEEMIVRGGFVCIDHGRGLFSLYNHLSRIDVEPGQLVEPGQQIGLAGSTGVATGPHLHFEIRLTTWAVDPLRIIAAPPSFK
jgi:murein DD-endopeptidase MepM/ murein hydrolase activator NlpD